MHLPSLCSMLLTASQDLQRTGHGLTLWMIRVLRAPSSSCSILPTAGQKPAMARARWPGFISLQRSACLACSPWGQVLKRCTGSCEVCASAGRALVHAGDFVESPEPFSS